MGDAFSDGWKQERQEQMERDKQRAYLKALVASLKDPVDEKKIAASEALRKWHGLDETHRSVCNMTVAVLHAQDRRTWAQLLHELMESPTFDRFVPHLQELSPFRNHHVLTVRDRGGDKGYVVKGQVDGLLSELSSLGATVFVKDDNPDLHFAAVPKSGDGVAVVAAPALSRAALRNMTVTVTRDLDRWLSSRMGETRMDLSAYVHLLIAQRRNDQCSFERMAKQFSSTRLGFELLTLHLQVDEHDMDFLLHGARKVGRTIEDALYLIIAESQCEFQAQAKRVNMGTS